VNALLYTMNLWLFSSFPNLVHPELVAFFFFSRSCTPWICCLLLPSPLCQCTQWHRGQGTHTHTHTMAQGTGGDIRRGAHCCSCAVSVPMHACHYAPGAKGTQPLWQAPFFMWQQWLKASKLSAVWCPS